MDLNEIKIGAKIACDAKIAEIDGDVVYIEFSAHKKFRLGAEMVELFDAQLLSPENGRKNTAPAPKYDPCRLFRKGDKVRVVERDGRDYIDFDPYTSIQKSEIYTVLENEEEVIDGGCVGIRIGKGNVEYEIPFYYLELVTPVEELERYVVEPGDVAWFVVDKKHESGEINVVMYMCALHPHAKEAAEAECARLNAEHRKEEE